MFNIKVHSCDKTKNNDCVCPIINKVLETKYLGVIIDHRLSWYSHIEHVTGRIRKLGWIFKTLRNIAPTNIKKKLGSHRNLLNEIYISLAQSVIAYCITIWGGAAKSKFIHVERGQRAVIKIMYFKKITYPTESLYQDSGLLSVRKLYILYTVLKKHKNLPFDRTTITRRRKDLIAQVPQTKTKFAAIQYIKLSGQLYNRINKKIYIHNKQLHECKKILTNWIKTLNYADTEALLQHTK